LLVSVQLEIAQIVADRKGTTTVELSVIMSSWVLFEIRPHLAQREAACMRKELG